MRFQEKLFEFNPLETRKSIRLHRGNLLYDGLCDRTQRQSWSGALLNDKFPLCSKMHALLWHTANSQRNSLDLTATAETPKPGHVRENLGWSEEAGTF